MLFGEYLLEQGLVKDEDILTALDRQRREVPFTGFIAAEMGLMNAQQILSVLHDQVVNKRKFVDSAILLGLLSIDEGQAVLREQTNRRVPLGGLLVELGFLTKSQMKRALRAYVREQNAVDGDDAKVAAVPTAQR